ncbi:MAG: carboxylating nicotinate-nucleotide diphosphorylase [Thermoguttaceae bacterium]
MTENRSGDQMQDFSRPRDNGAGASPPLGSKEFHQVDWDHLAEKALRQLVAVMLEEDLGAEGDCTSLALVPEGALGRAAVVARAAGVVAGLKAAEVVLAAVDPSLKWHCQSADGRSVSPDEIVARVEGPARKLLAAERPALNLIGRLSGIATLTRRYVDAVAGTRAGIYDTRKTTPGLRRLEKYAVRCGGGRNHRQGLYEAILIKDNHLALGAGGEGGAAFSPAEAVERARRYLRGRQSPEAAAARIVEIEVDTLEQLAAVLPVRPDIVLLDNMPCDQLRQAVAQRDACAPGVQLEASGGVDLETVRAIAETGVDRISVGALTHSAVALDVALDWT